MQRKLRIGKPSLPEHVVSDLRETETEINHRFNVDVDIVTKAQYVHCLRNSILPLYERLMDRIDPSVVILIDSQGKTNLIESCKRKNIPVVELQHGVIHDHHFQYSYPVDASIYAFPDYLLTFGKFWSDNARFPIPDEQVIPVGNQHLERKIDNQAERINKDQILFISQHTIGLELSRFAVAVHEDPRINHDIVYKLHPSEQDCWQSRYPHLTQSDVTVITGSKPPLYQLLAESSVQIGVYSTAIFEGFCFDLETFVFETDQFALYRSLFQPLIDEGDVTLIASVDELATEFKSTSDSRLRRERFLSQMLQKISYKSFNKSLSKLV